MGSMKSKLTTAMVAATVLAALSVPMIAGALPGAGVGSSHGARPVDPNKGPAEISRRLIDVLQTRKARFDASVSTLSMRIDRVAAIADKVAKAGGDVTGTRAKLTLAKVHIDQARLLEQTTTSEFGRVLAAADRPAAFRGAREKGRLASAELKLARTDLRAAAQELRGVVKRLRAQSATGAANAQ